MIDAANQNKANMALIDNIREKYYQASYKNRAYKNYQFPAEKADEAVLERVRLKAQRDARRILMRDALILCGVIGLFLYWWL